MIIRLKEKFIYMNDLINKLENKKAKICVIGLGYVGLPLSILLSQKGYEVLGIDIDEKKN